MSLPTTDVIFAQVRAVSGAFIEYPFIETGDSVTRVYHMPCQVNRNDYNGAQLTLDATMASAGSAGVIALPFASDTSAYFIGDFSHRSIDGGLIEFDRLFAMIPATRNDSPSGTTAFTYPGIVSTDTDGTERTVSNASNASKITTITCTNTVTVGETVFINISSTQGGVGLSASGFYIALTGTTGSVVKIPAVSVGNTFVSGTLTELTIQPKAQKSMPTGSLSDFTYYLPGVTGGITDPTDVIETPIFAPYSANTGESVNVLAETTIPNSSSYAAQVTAGDFIVIESNVTRWRGNILQKQNVKVRAL